MRQSENKDTYFLDDHKLYWHLDRLLQWQNGELIAPIYIEISPTAKCNHRCLFCGLDFARKNIALDGETMERVLSEISSYGVKSVMFAGEGEPLLHPHLSNMIHILHQNGVDVAITTNGSITVEGFWEKTLPSLCWIKFSVDAGSPDVYSKVHGVPEHFFEKTIQNIEDVLSIKKKNKLSVTVGVQYILIQENIEDLKNALKIFTSMELDYFVIKPFSKHPLMKNTKDETYHSDLLEYIDSLIADFSSMNPRIIFRENAFTAYMKKKMGFSKCRALPFWGYISSNGDFYTCSVKLGDKKFIAGNIFKDKVAEILFGAQRKQSIEYALNCLEPQKDCRLNCRMAPINRFLEFIASPPPHINFI